MSNQFLKLRRSAVPGKIPDTGSLDLGEIALNTHDGRAFMKKSVGGTEQIVIIGDTSGSFTGSFSGSFTGSLQGTASWAINALTASTADDFFVRGNITGSNALINGTITAQTLIVQTVSSSIIYSSGSNIFGDELTDTQQFTGSVTITGSLSLNNDPVVTQIPYNTFSSSIQLRATKLESTASILTAASASFAQDSGSNSIRFTDLESTSSALTSASASFSTRVTTLEAASASFATDSGSNSIRITHLENTASVLTQASASFSSSIALLSGSFLSFSSSYNTGSFTGSFFGTARLINSQFSGSTQITGSLGVTGSVSISGSVGNVFSANIDTMTFTGSLYQTGSTFITGTLSVFGGITGSLFGTSSWAVSASHAPSALTSSYAITASHALTASSADNFLVRQDITASNALINGTLTATTIVAQYITSSTEYITGSTKFGSELINTHEFTGSVTITGSLSLNNDPVVTQAPYNAFSSSIQLRATNLESTASILTSASASLAQDSGSNSIRFTDLESTASVLTTASASFALVSGSYSSASGSLSTRVTTLENASSSFAADSGSNSIRITNLESTSSILTSASASLAQDSGSNSIRITNLESTASVLTQASASFSSSISYLSSSFIAFSQSYNTGSFTGSFFGKAALTGSFTGSFSGTLSGSFSGSVANIDGQTNFIAKFDSPNSIDSSVIYQSGSHIAINETNFTAGAPEALYVFQTDPTSINVVTGKGNTNHYLQLNIQNTNQGISASSDIVATANNGNEFTNYIDMGINSENYSQNFIGSANDAYVYSIANNLHIGNAATNGTHLGFFVGGEDVEADNKLQLNPVGPHKMSGSLDITGSLTVTTGITGSLFGTASWAISASHAPSALTSSYAITASYSLTATSASHAINSDIAISASYAATASSANDFLVRQNITASNALITGTLTAQTIIAQYITSSTEFITGSTKFGTQLTDTHQFTGSVTITGSLSLNNDPVVTQTPYNTFSQSIQLRATNLESTASILTTASASLAQDSGSNSIRFTNLESTASVLTSASASFALASGSLSTRVTTLENASASFAQDSGSNNIRLTNLESTASVLTVASASFVIVSGSYSSASGSLSTRVTNLESTASILTIASASFALVSGSYSQASQSLSTRTTNLESTASVLTTASSSFSIRVTTLENASASFAQQSGSNSIRFTNLETTASVLTQASASFSLVSASYSSASGSLSTRVTNLESTSSVLTVASASFAIVSASYSSASGSLSIRTTNLETTASVLTQASASFAQDSGSNNIRITNLESTASVLTTASASFAVVSASFSSTSQSISNRVSIIEGNYATTGSNVFRGNQTVTGSLFTSGSNTLVGSTTLTGSLNVSGSTIQTGNNTLIGNTTLSGSITISGSSGPGSPTASVQIYGDIRQSGYHRFDPVSTNINNSISASYIYVSGSTNDLYFTQNGAGYGNTTRLRWIEGNLYTGLLNGGLITTQSSTVYQVSSGSGIIVDLNASLNDNPYPTVQYLNWPNLTGSISAFTSSYQQLFVGVDNTNNLYAQGTPFTNGQFDTLIAVGDVFFQNGSTINGVKTAPSLAYGWKQRSNVFISAFGPLKLSGFTLAPSGSSTGSLIIGSGTAFADGQNYTIDPDNPSYIIDSGTNVSKIFRYYQSGSSWVYQTNAGAGFGAIDPANYSNNGTLTSVGAGNWSIQRVFWFPNSVTKAIVVYYGNAIYATEAEAIANLSIESFVEAPNTAANAVYVGSIVISGNGVFTNTSTFTILPGGLFRQVGGSGGGGSVVTQTLSGLSDVSISGPTNGQPLVYNSTSGKWENSSTLVANLTGNASTATTASFAVTASYVLNAVSASYALSASSAAQANTASYVLQAVSASYALNATTASFANQASTASYVLQAVSASFASQAATASYVLNAVSASYALNATTASHALTASSADSLLVRQSVTASNALITGTLTAQTIIAQYITSSTEFITGSTKFGSQLTDTHQFTGSVSITGSLAASLTNVNQTNVVGYDTTTGRLYYQATSSLSVPTASYALTASNVIGGNTNYITRWITPTRIGDSAIYQSSSYIGINTSNPDYTLTLGFSERLGLGVGYVAGRNIIDSYDTTLGNQLPLDFKGDSYNFKVGGFDKLIVDNGGTTVTGSLSVSALASSNKTNVVTYDTVTGQLYYQSTSSLSVTTSSYALTSSGVQGGTTNYVPLWTSPTTLSSSMAYQTGSLFVIPNKLSAGYITTSSYTSELAITYYPTLNSSTEVTTANGGVRNMALSGYTLVTGAPTAAQYGGFIQLETSKSNASNVGALLGGDVRASHWGSGTTGNITGLQALGYIYSGSTTSTIRGAFAGAYSYTTGNVTQTIGVHAQSNNYGTGTVSRAYAVDAFVGNRVTGNITDAIAVGVQIGNYQTGTITNAYGISIGGINDNWSNSGGGTITNTYGLYIASTIDLGSTSRYAIYSDSTSNTYIKANVGINQISPGYKLDVAGDANITANLTATGSIKFPSLSSSNQLNVVGYDTTTGQLFYQSTSSLSVTTASYAISSSNAATASSADNFNVRNNLLLPSIANQQVLYKSGSLVTGSSDFTWNYNSKLLSINGGSSIPLIQVNPSGVDGVYLGAGNSIATGEAGLYSANSDQPIALYNYNSSEYYYSNGNYKFIDNTDFHQFTGSAVISQNITASNALITDTITAQRLVVQTVTSSIVYSSGSNIFGSQLTDIQQFTGSIRVTASGNHWIMGGSVGIGTNDITGKLHVNDPAANTLMLQRVSEDSGPPEAIGRKARGTINAKTGVLANDRLWFFAAAGYVGTEGIDGVWSANKVGMNYVASENWTSTAQGTHITWATTAVGGTTRSDKMKLTGDGKLGLNNATPEYNLDVTGNANVTANLTATGSIKFPSLTSTNQTNVVGYDTTTGQLYYQSTSSLNVTSASYAATSSYAYNFTIQNTLNFAGTLTDYATVASSVAGSNNLFTQAVGSYTSAFFKYTVTNGANARTGEVMAVWNGSTVQFTDNSTLDIGTTTPVTCSVSIVGSDVLFNVQTNTSGWNIKSIGTFM